MSIELLRYPTYACFILLLILMTLQALLLVIHFFAPKSMLRTYFKEPYFSSTEVAFFSTFPFFFMRTVMFMRLAGWPNSGKRRGLTDAYELAPLWFRVVSKVFILIFLISFFSLILLGSVVYAGFCYLGHC